MKRINLKEYPKFWTDFTGRIMDNIDPSAPLSGTLVKRCIKDWYGIDVHIMHSGLMGEVYMLEPEYVVFLLKWS